MLPDYDLFINSVAIIQIVLFSAGLILMRKCHRASLYLLWALFLALFFGKFDDLLQQTGLILHYPHLSFFSGPIVLLQGPIIYFYVRSRLEPGLRFESPMLLHAIWSLPIILLMATQWWFLGAEEKIALLQSGQLVSPTTVMMLQVHSDSVLIVYLYLSVRKLRVHGLQMHQWFSNIKDRNLSGVRTMLTLFAIMTMLHLGWTLVQYFWFSHQFTEYLSNLLLTFHLILITGLYQEFVTHDYSSDKENETAVKALEKPAPSLANITLEEQRELIQRLNKIMEGEQCYLDADLTLLDLAKLMKIHARTLSNLVNEHHKSNFHGFINQYRINFAKRVIKQFPEKTIIEIAYDSGFNSKSVFNTAFKRFVKQTPTEYRHSL